ncbi:enoyl-CoA hydratase [Rhodobacteraceae bacterium WD3A24]|nr:enoyl-CoA hydratase [Rhodobacteraceae bacterium WD3A24]
MDYIENRSFDEIAPGESAEITRELTTRDIELFALASGDVNPTHFAGEASGGAVGGDVIGHAMWAGALISAVLGTRLPGPGMTYVEQDLHFARPVRVGETVVARVSVAAKDAATVRVTLDCRCETAEGETVVTGTAVVHAARERIRRPRAVLPEIALSPAASRFRALVEQARALDPLVTAVVHPCDALSLEGALDAHAAALITPLLVGPREKIEAAAQEAGRSIDGIEIIDAPHSHAAAEAAVGLVREGRAGALMKGKLHTDELLEAVLDKDRGLRTERRLSHVFALDVPTYPRMLMVTDAAINIDPELETLADIVQNALDLARAIGVECPRAALLSAVETVTGRLPSTLKAAAICKMHDRGQITGGLVDGPLAFDNAVSEAAAAAKGIESQVAGRADILVAPDLESGNMIAKQLIHLAGADSAGIALGARVPIMLTSRSDTAEARLASAALAQIHAHRTP